MKSYYHDHELAYQQIQSKGFVGWGNAKTLNELGDVLTKEYLQSVIPKFFTAVRGQSALDLGCGSGTTAFLLARLGFAVTGIDVSETAVQMAKDLSLQQGLEIDFRVQDILNEAQPLGKFDLIYDSHCLHCIVFENDRALALRNVKKALSDEGLFILDTMVMPAEHIDLTGGNKALRFDENCILWHKTRPSSDYGVVEVDGQYWCAQRRIWPAETVLEEVERAGFQILSQVIDLQPREPSMLRLVLK
jgi:2-polyprenyl-6-hydroxyphenyl methylase/3-demethylubiquinone-9 3-methyltransferase